MTLAVFKYVALSSPATVGDQEILLHSYSKAADPPLYLVGFGSVLSIKAQTTACTMWVRVGLLILMHCNLDNNFKSWMTGYAHRQQVIKR